MNPHETPTPRELRRFALTVGGALLALGAAGWLRGRGGAATVLGTLGVLLVAAGLLVPARLGSVYRGWMGLALAISRVTTPLFMGVVYFVVLTPLGLARRLAGHRLGAARGAPTAWVDRPPGTRRGDLRRQF